MKRIVTIIWRACSDSPNLTLDYLILYKASKRLSNLVSHFEGIAVNVEVHILLQFLEVKSYFTVFQSSGASNVHPVKGADISPYYR